MNDIIESADRLATLLAEQNAVYKYNQKAFHNKHLFYANILFY